MDSAEMRRLPLDLPSSFATILAKAREGDSSAETTVYQSCLNQLVALASRRINQRFRSKIDAEDVAQSVLASFFRRNNQGEFQLDDWNELWALLVSITMRKCVNKVEYFLSSKRNIRREASAEGAENLSSEYRISNDPTAEEIALFNESLDQLFNQLTEMQQRVVCLRLQGMSNLEISENLACSERMPISPYP